MDPSQPFWIKYMGLFIGILCLYVLGSWILKGIYYYIRNTKSVKIEIPKQKKSFFRWLTDLLDKPVEDYGKDEIDEIVEINNRSKSPQQHIEIPDVELEYFKDQARDIDRDFSDMSNETLKQYSQLSNLADRVYKNVDSLNIINKDLSQINKTLK